MRRSEGKEATRRALLQAALKLLASSGFDGLSLREVTREAGVSPTAFYRHFADMEELGLVLVEESFGSLRAMLRDARDQPTFDGRLIQRSIDIVLVHLRNHTADFRFIARERSGGVRRLRRAIRRELELFADELAIDLAGLPPLRAWPTDDRRMLAGLIAETVVRMVAELLEADPGEQDAIVERTERQLLLVALGATAWRSGADARVDAPA